MTKKKMVAFRLHPVAVEKLEVESKKQLKTKTSVVQELIIKHL